MRRIDLEHVIRAAAMVADVDELIVVGSQSILGACPHAPQELLVSQEVDLYPKRYPERAELIEGALGELSMFHETFGYYAQAVGPETCVLAAEWEQRLVKIQNEGTRGAIAWCLSPADLMVAKLSAQRDKDFPFVRVAVTSRIVSVQEIHDLLAQVQLADELRRVALGFLSQLPS
jgi:hypothetical protein